MTTPRQELLAHGAHEVLNPLANVVGFAHLLNRLAAHRPADWSPESRTSIAMLVGEAERLKTVTEAFLELLRLQDGLFELSTDEVEVDSLVHEELRAFGRRWPNARVVEDFADTASTVRTDEARLRFVLRAVLDVVGRGGGTTGRIEVRSAAGGVTVSVHVPVVEMDAVGLLVSGDPEDSEAALGTAEMDLATRVMQIVARRLGMTITLARRAGRDGAEIVVAIPSAPPAGVPRSAEALPA